MADISQITQELTQFGPAPDSLDPANFNQRGDATVAHLHTHVDEQNILTKQTNKVTREINERAADIDSKYDEIVDKHTDFIPKYKDAVTKHGQIETMHTEIENNTSHVETRKGEIDAIKTHIDERKNQIDTDLATAKSFINEQNNVINDMKTSAVSTWSSENLQNKFDAKVGIADDTVTINNLKISKEKNITPANSNSEILFRANSSEAFNVVDINKLYADTLKDMMKEDFVFEALSFSYETIKTFPLTYSPSYKKFPNGDMVFFKNNQGNINLAVVTQTLEISSLSLPINTKKVKRGINGSEIEIFAIGGTNFDILFKLVSLDDGITKTWQQINNTVDGQPVCFKYDSLPFNGLVGIIADINNTGYHPCILNPDGSWEKKARATRPGGTSIYTISGQNHRPDGYLTHTESYYDVGYGYASYGQSTPALYGGISGDPDLGGMLLFSLNSIKMSETKIKTKKGLFNLDIALNISAFDHEMGRGLRLDDGRWVWIGYNKIVQFNPRFFKYYGVE